MPGVHHQRSAPLSTAPELDPTLPRCPWGAGDDLLYRRYHDREWGRPVTSDERLFEKICLEGFQSGLSWLTILRKRENFRAAFANFEVEKVAKFDEADMQRLLEDKGIVRHRGKIASTINNAKRAREMADEAGSLAAWFWKFEPGPDERPPVVDLAHLRANPTTAVSIRISKELKKKGWSFVGPTTVYAFMQAMGLVNDHLEGCACRAEVEAERKRFKRPK
jgi:DNA-3-methyladenine glycosylase I